MKELPNDKVEKFADLAELNFQAKQRWQQIEVVVERIKNGEGTQEDVKKMEKLSPEFIDLVKQMKKLAGKEFGYHNQFSFLRDYKPTSPHRREYIVRPAWRHAECQDSLLTCNTRA